MRKKVILINMLFIINLIFGISFFNHQMNAAVSNQAGGNVTARVNQAPANLTVNHAEFQKGDRILLGTLNPESGEPIALQLLKKSTYTSYNCPTHTATCSQSVPITAWLANTTEAIGHPTTGIQKSDYILTVSDHYAPYTSSNFYDAIQALNQTIHANDNKIFTYQDMKKAFDAIVSVSNSAANQQAGYNSLSASYNQTGFYLPAVHLLINALSSNDLKFKENLWTASFYHSAGSREYVNYYILGSSGAGVPLSSGADKNSGLESDGRRYALRASADVDLTKAVFAVSKGTAGGLANVTIPVLPTSYNAIYTDAVGSPMKVRVENPSLTASTTFNQIENDSKIAISKTVANKEVYLNVNAQAGNDGIGGIYTVSALIFNDKGDFLYYKVLEPAKGNGAYALDLTGIPLGKYKIGVVNEAYDENSTAPADSSLITNVLPLEIIGSHKIAYTKTPQSGASAGNDYEFSKNVNAGQAVGKITVNPQGAMPLTYAVVTNGDNTYQNFEVDGLDGNGATASASPNVKIKSNAPDLVNGSLKAGTYKFCITAVDVNGDPVDSNGNPTEKVCTSFTVAKTKTQVVFDDPSQTKKSVTDAATAWNENATATPSIGTKITYSVSGGDAYLIDIDKGSGEITYKGNGGFGKVKIKATADDDPSSGSDNYDSSFAEKEIVIYREVDGSVTPHGNSSSTTAPTFTASDTNVKVNGTIGTIKGTLGTPDTIGGTTTTYKYGLKTGGDSGLFSVDPITGDIKSTANLGVKSYTITVTVSDKWSTKEIPVTINVGVAAAEDLKFYETTAVVNAITTKSVKVTDTNVTVYATVKGSTNNNPVTYKIKDGSTNVIEVNPNSGAVTIHGVGTVTIVAEKKGATGQADASAELTFTVTAGEQEFIYTDNAGNELGKSGSNYSALTDTYAPNKTIQLYTAGNPTGSTVTYQLKAGSPTDVISVDASGLVTILNASLNNQMGKVIVQATSHDPSGNYSDKTIELPINIEKGTRTICFKENPIYVVNGSGSVTPVIEVDGVIDTSGNILVEVDSNEDGSIAWTDDNKTIEYDYTQSSPKDIKIHATKPMDRNYKAAEADGVIHIMGPDENVLAITSPGKITYGDHFTIKSSQYDADSTNVQYKFEIDDTTFISSPTVNVNSAEFDAIRFSGTTKTTITVTRTADGESPLSKKVQVTVLPKSITITIEDKEKLKGEVNPALTYKDFRSQLVSWNGVQDVIQEKDIILNTTAKTNSNAGNYPIKGNANTLNKAYPNYSFTFKEGTLVIIEEEIEDEWYHLEIDDGNNTAYEGHWTNQDVNIITDHNEYVNLSLDQNIWEVNQVTVSKEGETNQSFWMKKDTGAITKEKKEIIRIDKTPPKVKSIKAKDTNNKLQDIINKISGGIFFKPGTSFEVITSDAKGDLKVSGTKEIAYKVYKTEKQSRAGDELIKDGILTVTSEKASITISELTGTYKVCVIPTDHAGNTNTESCHELELKKIDVDVDGDGKPDFNDPDGDGCPDLNIKWKDPDNPDKWIVINGDRDYDGIPDLNIDNDGDGKPDLNIDTDGDGKPDLNLVILKKSDWKPTKCVSADIDSGILEEYCTGTSGKAVINVDTDDDGIPNINIDTNGDMKADYNIDKDNDGTPEINLGPDLAEWIPNKDYKSNKFTYDSIGKDKVKPELNIDTDGDGYPDINLDINGDGIPELNVDTDGDYIPDINIDSTGDGKPDTNVDTDDDGKPDENIVEITEWKPEKNIDGEFPYDTMSFDEQEEPSNDHDTSVKGQYNPATSMGGANTGDETSVMLYISLTLSTIGVICYLLYKYRKDTFQ